MAKLHLILFGSPRIERDQTPVVFSYKKAIGFLCYLAVTQREHSRQAVGNLLYQKDESGKAKASLRRLLYVVKQEIGEEWLQATPETLKVCSTPDLWVDVNEFQQLVTTAQEHAHDTGKACSQCIQQLSRAVSLYTDEFMAGFALQNAPQWDHWLMYQSSLLTNKFIAGSQMLSHLQFHTGDLEAAIATSQRILFFAPSHEPTHLHLMRLYLEGGKRGTAVQHYESYVRTIKEELGVGPSAEMNDLFEKIVNNNTASPKHKLEAEKSILSLRKLVAFQQLPTPLTPFIGRGLELTELAEKFQGPGCRLLTITGIGGVGKTRLAIKFAEMCAESFIHGVCFVPLASVNTHDVFMTTLGKALNIFFQSQVDPKIQILNFLKGKEILLVMDNIEHLLAEADMLLEILTVSQGSKILVTSRKSLNYQAESLYEIGGLAYPEEIDEEIEAYAAPQLLLYHAQRINNRFSLTKDDAKALHHICQQLEGMPLGLELAGSLTKQLTCLEIQTEIQKNLDILSTSARDIPERHHSLRAVFNLSWNQLSLEEQQAVAQLSVFQRDFSADAAQSIIDVSHSFLERLADKALIRELTNQRYVMHSVINRYASERLEQQPAISFDTKNRHSDYYSQWLHQKERESERGQFAQVMLEIAKEIGNLRSAWHWSVECGRQDNISLSIESLFNYYETTGWIQEGSRLFEHAVGRFNNKKEPTKKYADNHFLAARLTIRKALLEFHASNFEKSKQLANESLDVFYSLNSERELAFAMNVLGLLNLVGGELNKAEELFKESLLIGKKIAHPKARAGSLGNLGIVYSLLGQIKQARDMHSECLKIAQQIDWTLGVANALNNLGIIAKMEKKYSEAQGFFQQSLKIGEKLNNTRLQTNSLGNLADCAYCLKSYMQAEELSQKQLFLCDEISDKRSRVMILGDLGRVNLALKRYIESANYFLSAFDIDLDISTPPVVLATVVRSVNLLHELGKPAEKTVALLLLATSHSAISAAAREEGEELLAKITSELTSKRLKFVQKLVTNEDTELADVVEQIREDLGKIKKNIYFTEQTLSNKMGHR